MNDRIVVPGYKITDRISKNSNQLVYRGIRIEDQLPVILKMPKEGYPAKKLKHEFHILQSLHTTAVTNVVEYINVGRDSVLVMEDHGGVPLDLFLKMKRPSIKEIISICIRIARCIGETHQQHIIHKDINPTNILIRPDSLGIKLGGFGSATRLAEEYQSVLNQRELAASSPYVSPELTGRMNRSLDYRTDFYSFGIVAYEMLTGFPPFLSTDLLEMVHAHIALAPIPPHELNQAVPGVLSEIVLKCLAKNAEDRYLSISGLIADLQQCLHLLVETGKVEPFPIAMQDQTDRLIIPQKLYGRKQEVQKLADAFGQVANGAMRFILVSGSAGVGKSALVNEVQKSLYTGKGRFVRGKYDQLKREIPYSALLQAFQELIQQLLMEEEAELAIWREAILDAMQGLGQVIVEVIPQLEKVIGKQPSVPELLPAEAKNRFQFMMQRFIRVLARPDHPLVLFLDDLQWADTASLLLIQELYKDLQMNHLLLIGAYRSQEGTTNPAFLTILNELDWQDAIIDRIQLRPLDVTQINQLLADTLRLEPLYTMPLAKIMVQKTEGNPFFARQFLKSLYDSQLLTFRHEERCWLWDVDQIERLSTADNVAQFLVDKVLQLPHSTQRLLAYAACLGNTFFLDMLAAASSQEELDAAQQLWPAILEGLLYPLEGEQHIAYMADALDDFEDTPKVQFVFVHDRIQQAAYSLLGADEQKSAHLILGKMLEHLYFTVKSDDYLFEMCDHFSKADDLLEERDARLRVARYHLMAGQKAKSSTAYDAALQYLKRGAKLLPADAWRADYPLTIELYTLLAEAEYLCKNFAEAERLFRIVLDNAKTALERVRVLEIQIHMYTALANFPLVVEIANDALSQLNVRIPAAPGKLDLLREMLQIKRRLGTRNVERLLDLPHVPEESYKVAMNIISYAGPSSYFVNQNWFALTILRVLNLSLVHGNCVASANGYTGYGIVLCNKFSQYKSGHDLGRLGCQIAEKFQDPLAMTKAYGAFAIMINHWRNHAKTNIPLLKTAIQHGLESGGNIYVAYNSLGLLDAMFFCGTSLDELGKQLRLYAELIRQVKVVDHDDRVLLLHQFLDCLTLWKQDRTVFAGHGFDESAYVLDLHADSNGYKRYIYHFYKMHACYLFEQYAQAAALSIEAEQWIETVNGQLLAAQHYFMQSLALTTLYETANQEDRTLYRKKIKVNLSKMKRWAENSPENFLHKQQLMAAEWARVRGKNQEASNLYERSIQAARQAGFVQNEAIACECAAKFSLSIGLTTLAKVYMTEAYDAYLMWGAVAKAADLEEKYADLLYRSQSKASDRPVESIIEIAAAMASSPVNTQRPAANILDLMTVIKASQAMASEIKLENLLETMLGTVISSAGAQKGLLILKNEAEWLIEAAGYVGKDMEIMQSIPYDQSGLLCVSIVNYAIRTEEMVVLHDASRDERYQKDAYIAQIKPKSVLCAPLWKQGKMIGILYLENNIASHVFNEGRTELLRLIFSQIAIFIENARLYHRLEVWNHSLEKMVAERTGEIQKLLQDNKNLLNHAGQGFLLFSDNLVVHSEYSRECLRIFGKEIAGIAVSELLYPDHQEERMFIESLLHKYFETKNIMQKELYLTLMPQEITVNQLPVKLECRPIHDAGEAQIGLMLILTDLSEKRALENKMEQDLQILKMVVSVVTNIELFQAATRQFEAFFKHEWESFFANVNGGKERLFELIGRLHQFKGDFSQFHLLHTPQKLHDLETELFECIRQNDPDALARLGAAIEPNAVLQVMEQDMQMLRQRLGYGFWESKEQAVSFSQDRWKLFCDKLVARMHVEGDEELYRALQELQHRPVGELFTRYTDTVTQWAVRLGKHVSPLKIECDELWVNPDRFASFVSSLVHVFRNAVDHGIEDEEERLAQDKELWGSIRCTIKQEADRLVIAIADDGRGIDLEQVKSNWLKRNGVGFVDAPVWSEQEWLAKLFADDFSLKNEVSEMSGRGMGLAVVKRELEQLGGHVEVKTRKGEGTSFNFYVPLD
ncbi:GAF domain-containing protein [Brevibacillus fluminis]|uniref:histidine kinase n=1 Tax=Brevibacillus fluminis TaxID=511487 RepID=A0A3M8DT31_9BACL|nr:AAA family ATPase [Brevibacillus fluminis]RNB91256.1 GAF domain-containing protein [Brevibacillus fluminis]